MLPHEYSIIGHSRTNIGRYLGVLAGAFAALFYLVAGALLTWLEATDLTGLLPNLIFWPLSAGVIYWGIHWLFNNKLWKCTWAKQYLKIPNIEGEWSCTGKTMNLEGIITQTWTAKIAITQTWEKITVHMTSEKGQSNSTIASLLPEGLGHRLMYRYAYEANAGEPVNSHIGFCDLSFNSDLNEADGDYFNNKGRWTFGQMNLKRK